MLGQDAISSLPIAGTPVDANPPPVTDVFFVGLHRIRQGMVASTAAGMQGVLETA